MNTNIIFKSLANGFITLLVFALIGVLIKGMVFIQAVTLPYNLLIACFAAVGSYIGFTIREAKQA
jgi:hypothetical protein